jgi:hypothetical protein
MQTLMRVGGVIFGILAGGTVGGLIGWALGDFGGRAELENAWFLSMTAGAAIGLAVAIAVILRRDKRLGWAASILFGVISSVVAATAFVLLVSWQRRP